MASFQGQTVSFASSPKRPIRDIIQQGDLTQKEFQLFQTLESSLQWKSKPTIARVAGGWVRDKLLGVPSSDIDIALDDQTGVEFAHGVNDYLKFIGTATRAMAVIQVVSLQCITD